MQQVFFWASQSVVEYDLLFHSRHNGRDRTCIQYACRPTFNEDDNGVLIVIDCAGVEGDMISWLEFITRIHHGPDLSSHPGTCQSTRHFAVHANL